MEIDPEELYVKRLVVLLETEPQSNLYNQVILNSKQFKTVSRAVHSSFKEVGKVKAGRKEFVQCEMSMSEEEFKLPDHIKDIN